MNIWPRISTLIYLLCVVTFLVTYVLLSPSFSAAELLRARVFWTAAVLLAAIPTFAAACIAFPLWLVKWEVRYAFRVSLLCTNLLLSLVVVSLAVLLWMTNDLRQSQFQAVSPPIRSPNSNLLLVPMVKESYTDPLAKPRVTFDVRNSKDEFRHHVQSEAPGDEPWVLGWHDDHTVVLVSDAIGLQAWIVGIDSMVYEVPEPLPDDILATGDRLRTSKTP